MVRLSRVLHPWMWGPFMSFVEWICEVALLVVSFAFCFSVVMLGFPISVMVMMLGSLVSLLVPRVSMVQRS